MTLVLTPALIRQVREVAGIGLLDSQKAVERANTTFDGDLLAGIGYIHRAALAMRRRDPERQLRQEALDWAAQHRQDPKWQDLLQQAAS